MLSIKNTVGFNLFKKVFSLYLIITIIVTIFHMYSEYKNEKNKIILDMNNIGISSKRQLTAAAWIFDNNIIEEIFYGILTSRYIIGISYKSQDNSVYNYGTVDIKNKLNSKKLLTNKVKTLYKKDLLSNSFILSDEKYNNNEYIGTIILYSDNTVILENVKNNFMLILINSFIKTFFLWIIFLFLANKYLTKPFFEIMDILNNFDFSTIENKKFQLNKKVKNEFDLLKQSYNIVFKRLANANIKYINLNENLEIKIKERTSELIESNDELEQTVVNLKDTQDKLIESEKMASLGNLVAGVAHEINTPVGVCLTGVTHFLDITKNLEKDYKSNNMSEEQFEEYLTVSNNLAAQINTNLERTAHLIKSFKQIAVDQSIGEERKFDLEEYIKDVIFSLNNIIKKENVKINLTKSGNMIINSNPGLYSQIITNLIINSLKHAFDSSIAGIININLINKNDSLEIVYEDNGNGITKENLSKIFDPFFTTNRGSGGTGLGLNIVYNIVTSQLDGTIKCNSIEGEGVTFTIYINNIY